MAEYAEKGLSLRWDAPDLVASDWHGQGPRIVVAARPAHPSNVVTAIYTVDGGALSFRGTANMQATVSEMVGGWKGALLSPADRFFKKDGAGTKVKIYLRGSRQDPLFGVYF